MLSTIIAILLFIAVIVLWVLSIQRRLVVLDENIGYSMCQIGVQLSSRFDALMTILNLVKGYAGDEDEALIETVKSRRKTLTSKSSPDEVLRQEELIFETLGRIAMMAEQYPELKANQTYWKAMDAVEIFDNMLRTSRLIYNDSVMKLNREIRMLPISMIAGVLGFRKREYLEEKSERVDMPS